MAASTAAIVGLCIAWLAWPSEPPAAVLARPAAAKEERPAVVSALIADAAVTRAPVPNIPPGVTREQWLVLEQEVRLRTDGTAELARIADYLAWSDTLRRFREARGNVTIQAELAPVIDAGLAERLRKGEVSLAEARQIKIAILELTPAEPAERAAELKRWVATEVDATRPDPRQAAFERRQQEIVAVWSAQPSGARDPSALETELEALRRQSFAAPLPTAR